MKKFLQNILRLRKDVGINFYIADFFHRRILRQNAKTSWAIHHSSTVIFPERITKGKNVFPGDSPGNYIEASNGIIIGDYTNLGPNVGILSSNHDTINNTIYTPAPPIQLGKFCWVGMNAVILPGIKLGDFTVVGAGAVVTKSFTEGYCIIAGSPARIIKQLDKVACLKYYKTKFAN
jgi:acetyltransferase-like isoleucine patch superfamily enzyme